MEEFSQVKALADLSPKTWFKIGDTEGRVIEVRTQQREADVEVREHQSRLRRETWSSAVRVRVAA